jgi:ribosome-binding factor A
MAQQTSYRAERVNELIRRELVLLLSKETKDPRLQEVVITDVKVSRDLTSAKVFFSVDESAQKTVTTLLNKASGFF